MAFDIGYILFIVGGVLFFGAVIAANLEWLAERLSGQGWIVPLAAYISVPISVCGLLLIAGETLVFDDRTRSRVVILVLAIIAAVLEAGAFIIEVRVGRRRREDDKFLDEDIV